MAQGTDGAEALWAGKLRDEMTDRLACDGWVDSPETEAAFRKVPRHLFVPPGTSLDRAYDAGEAVITKRGPDGTDLSSVSAPWLQARMIAQAGIAPGMRVLEIGSGGYNAALLAEITGEAGAVVTMDIDPEVTARADAALEAAGYGGRVTVVTGDGEQGVAQHAPYDAIVVTAGAWDIPPAWADQLTDDGTLVVPLRMNLITRSIAFRRRDDHWASVSAEMCGFVLSRGAGARPEPSIWLADPAGHVVLRFDENVPGEPGLLDGALAAGRAKNWTGITIGSGMSFADLHLWFAAFLPGFCKVAASEGTALAAEKVGTGWFPFGCAHGDSFAYQASRKLDGPGAGFEFGAGAFGPHADEAADAMAEQITEWDRHGRDLASDAFAFWPSGVVPPARTEPTGIFPKIHGTVTVCWPAPLSS